MNDKPAEILVFDFLEEAFEAAAETSVLHGLELHDTVYQKIKTGNGVRLSDADSDLSSSFDASIKEFDARLIVVCFSRVIGKEKSNRQEAIQKVFDISRAVSQLFFDAQDLGGRVCSSLVLRGSRGFDSIDGQPFAVANIPVVINPSGQYDFQRLRL